MGSGKTLILTVLAKLTDIKQKIVSNYKLELPNYVPFDIEKFINNKYEDCMILLDEGYVYLDSRISMDKRNRLMSYVLFQSRKKNVELYITVQLKGTIDIRYRQLTDYIIQCQKVRDGFKYIIHRPNNYSEWKVALLTFEKAAEFWDLYDTNEIIEDTSIAKGAFLSRGARIEKIVELSDIISENYYCEYTEKYPDKTPPKIKRTYINNYLRFENLDPDFGKEIYDYLNSKI